MSKKKLVEPTDIQYATFGRYVAVMMGANLEWDSAADYLGDFAERAAGLNFPSIGDQGEAELKLWRKAADQLGIDYPEYELP